MEFLDYISTWSVLKWIILVLVAGFIGQFGRMSAEMIAAKVRLRRAKKRARSETDEKLPGIESSSPPKAKERETPSHAAVTEIPSDKKALKTLAKIRKKELKAKNKNS